MKLIFSVLSTILSTVIVLSGTVSAQSPYVSGSVGVDVSWPNCSNSIGPAAFGIVGVSNGTGYSSNPCLSQESSHFLNNLGFYVNTGWDNKSTHVNSSSPKACTSGDNNCLAYNYGYNAGLYAYNAAKAQGLSSRTWWLDVETDNTWNTNTTQNRNSLQGEYDALSASGATTIGVYSTTAQWQSITGDWYNSWPSWGATTWTTAAQAQTYCMGHEFTGGPSYLMQYKSKKTAIDQDVAC